MGDHRLGHLEDPTRIDGERRVPEFRRQLLDRGELQDAGIVDEGVDMAETLHRFRHRAAAIGGIADIGQSDDATAAVVADLGRGFIQRGFLGRKIGQRQVVAALGEPDGDGAADAPAGARDDGLSGHVCSRSSFRIRGRWACAPAGCSSRSRSRRRRPDSRRSRGRWRRVQLSQSRGARIPEVSSRGQGRR